MTTRRKPSVGRRRATKRRQRPGASERWLLLGLAVGGIIGFGMLSPRPQPMRPAPVRHLSMAQARSSNAAVPIEVDRRRPAAPYRFRGGLAERAQAIDCLATAALYEAGDDRRGQRAVIQVVLNRARSAGFPRTICGVVYQGALRTTGCQFSFTCDGSIRRRTIHLGWANARAAARHALAGHVEARVGRATHYHADWMVPYWRDTLVKVAKVGDHVFYVRR